MAGTAASVCTTALCSGPATFLVCWKAQPEPLPFCRECADKLGAHGDHVQPMAADPPVESNDG